MKTFMVRTLVVSLAMLSMALVGLYVQELASACGVCEIFWDSSDPTCDETDGSDVYGHTLHTRGSSSGHGTWTLLQKVSKLSGSNVTNVKADPSSKTIVENSGIAEFNISTLCTGELDIGTKDGFSDLNAWDATCFACSGAHRVDIMKNGDFCP